MSNYHGKIKIVNETSIMKNLQKRNKSKDILNNVIENLEKIFNDINDIIKYDTGRGIDLCIVDHINLLKFGDDTNEIQNAVNVYSNFFREQALNWCGTGSPVAMLVVSQANNDGQKYWEKLEKSANDSEICEGDYLLSHFAGGMDLARASSVVLTIYFNDTKPSQARVSVLKNRDGQTMKHGIAIDVQPEYYTIGDKNLNIREYSKTDNNVQESQQENNIQRLEKRPQFQDIRKETI